MHIPKSGANSYLEQMVLAASPVELVRLLYARALTAVRDAREHLLRKRIAERCASINIACAVLTELSQSLLDSEAAEFSSRLRGLYGYMLGRLVEANMHQADEPLAEVTALLGTLADAWATVPATLGPRGAEAGDEVDVKGIAASAIY